jgi:hypothetical protein
MRPSFDFSYTNNTFLIGSIVCLLYDTYPDRITRVRIEITYLLALASLEQLIKAVSLLQLRCKCDCATGFM